jgi:glycosyltransferase involved in cell wall biosynthesis
MKIAHICIGSSYTEGLSYQENMLVNEHASDGHDVLIVSDCHAYVEGRLTKVSGEDRILNNGARLIRLPYVWFGSEWISSKLRKVKGLMVVLDTFKPDVMLFHGVAGWELKTIGAYSQKHPEVSLYVDCHEDRNNSGTNIISRLIQYKFLTRLLLRGVLPNIKKILYVSEESRDFLIEMYDLDERLLEFYPLGGKIVEPGDKLVVRKEIRGQLGIEDTALVFLHSGKFDKKKRTLELLTEFAGLKELSALLLVVGSFSDEIWLAARQIIEKDARIRFLGWQSGDYLRDLMCACDVYLQPGSQSASLQSAICVGLPVMVYPYPSHKVYLKGNGCYVKSKSDISACLKSALSDREQLKKMSDASYGIARSTLDYRLLAARILY